MNNTGLRTACAPRNAFGLRGTVTPLKYLVIFSLSGWEDKLDVGDLIER